MKIKKIVFFVFLIFSTIFIGFSTTKIHAAPTWNDVIIEPYDNLYTYFLVGTNENMRANNRNIIVFGENRVYIANNDYIAIDRGNGDIIYYMDYFNGLALACFYDPTNTTLFIFPCYYYQRTTGSQPILHINDNYATSIFSNATEIEVSALNLFFRSTTNDALGSITNHEERKNLLNGYINYYVTNSGFLNRYGDLMYNAGIYNQKSLEEVEEEYNNDITLWIRAILTGINSFFAIRLGSVSLGAIILIPFSITIVWFIIKQFRGGGD